MKFKTVNKLFYAAVLVLWAVCFAGCSELGELENIINETEETAEEAAAEEAEEDEEPVSDENGALNAAIKKAHEEYDGTFTVNEGSAFIYEENDSCYLIFIELEGAGFVSAYVVQKGINKVVYSGGAQDYWEGILDDYYMQYVVLESEESRESNITGLYYDVLAEKCGGTPNLYNDIVLNEEELKYYRSMYDDVYVDNCSGIYYLSLTDMDNDGVQEMIFVYAEGMFTVISDEVIPYGSIYIYTAEEGRAVKLYESDKIFLGSVNGSCSLGISSVNGCNYFIIKHTGIEGAYALEYDIYSKNGSSAVLFEKLYSISEGMGKAEYRITKNGEEKSVSEDEFISEASIYMNYNKDEKLTETAYESLPVFEPHNTIERLLDSHVLDNLKN